jgi:hypothetical protein
MMDDLVYIRPDASGFDLFASGIRASSLSEGKPTPSSI